MALQRGMVGEKTNTEPHALRARLMRSICTVSSTCNASGDMYR